MVLYPASSWKFLLYKLFEFGKDNVCTNMNKVARRCSRTATGLSEAQPR